MRCTWKGRDLVRAWFPVLGQMGVANGITTAGAAAGFIGILAASQGEFRLAAALLFGAIVCDRLDGMVATRRGETSAFGGQLDSLSDGLSLCLLPAYLGYRLGLDSTFAVAILTFFVLAGLWRLADFNLEGTTNRSGRSCFRGIPTTVAASWLLIAISLVLVAPDPVRSAVLLAVFGASALLMISPLPYPKEGMATKILYVALPLAMLFVWLP